MAYADIADMAKDQQLQERIIACAATEDKDNPSLWVAARVWSLVGSPGWGDAYAYARAAGNAQPGRDGAVITDPMILSAVQALN